MISKRFTTAPQQSNAEVLIKKKQFWIQLSDELERGNVPSRHFCLTFDETTDETSPDGVYDTRNGAHYRVNCRLLNCMKKRWNKYLLANIRTRNILSVHFSNDRHEYSIRISYLDKTLVYFSLYYLNTRNVWYLILNFISAFNIFHRY